MEIGGYIELDRYSGRLYHEDLIKLNSGRNALVYVIRARSIRKIAIPVYMCESVYIAVEKYTDAYIRSYHTDKNFRPVSDLDLEDGEWLYLMNYYGQLSNSEISEYCEKYNHRVIVDSSHSYFQECIQGVDTIFCPKKYFGVPDGSFLSTDVVLKDELALDESFDRMHFLLGRFERPASEFYDEFSQNNERFKSEPVKQMSKLTTNLLCGIDYELVKQRRTDNFAYLNKELGGINKLNLVNTVGGFMYPLWIDGGDLIRKYLQSEKVYIPVLWPNVVREQPQGSLEKEMVLNILPLPIDQRYELSTMQVIVDKIRSFLKK